MGMFVVMYDLSDMPPSSQTFLRQRTLYMPCDQSDAHPDSRKWLRYLTHLRLASSKTGKIYLHTDVRMIIFRKSDLDTATDYTPGKGFELRSFTRGPTNPKFSPRKLGDSGTPRTWHYQLVVRNVKFAKSKPPPLSKTVKNIENLESFLHRMPRESTSWPNLPVYYYVDVA